MSTPSSTPSTTPDPPTPTPIPTPPASLVGSEVTATRAVRVLTADLDPARPTLDDATYSILFGLQGDSADASKPAADVGPRLVRLVAADALETIATSEVLVSKVIRNSAGVSTDGAKVSSELRARAAALRAQVAADDADDAYAATGGYDVLPFGRY